MLTLPPLKYLPNPQVESTLMNEVYTLCYYVILLTAMHEPHGHMDM